MQIMLPLVGTEISDDATDDTLDMDAVCANAPKDNDQHAR